MLAKSNSRVFEKPLCGGITLIEILPRMHHIPAFPASADFPEADECVFHHRVLPIMLYHASAHFARGKRKKLACSKNCNPVDHAPRPARKNPYPRRRIHRRCGHRALSVYPFRLIVIPTFGRHLPRLSEPFSMGIVSKETRLGDCWRVFLPRLSSSSIIWALSSAICSMGSFR